MSRGFRPISTLGDLWYVAASVHGASSIYSVSVEVLELIMVFAGPRTMLGLARTCRTFRNAFLAHMQSMTLRAITDFGLPARELMRCMLNTSSVIAGSVAANVITGSRYEPSALDVVTPASEEHSMRAVLGQNMGCTPVDSVLPTGMQGSMWMLYEFEKEGRSIRLWVAVGENASVPVMLTSTTFVMNFISPWGIYCAYPTLTLVRRGLVNHFTEADDDSNGDAFFSRVGPSFCKYVERGVVFEVNDRNWADTLKKHRCFTSATCPHTIRSLYDRSGLHISFPVAFDGLHDRATQNIRLDNNHTTIWSLGGGYCNEPLLYHAAFSQSKTLYSRVSDVSIVLG